MAKSRTAAAKAKPPAPKEAPKAAPKAEGGARPSCGTCPFLDSKPTTAGHICKRFPQGVLKGRSDWCGEHPEIYLLRPL